MSLILIPVDQSPRTRRGNCAGCGAPIPEGTYRIRYELCNRCLKLGGKKP